ncbi:unnamed protein product [Diabrotica balteata]|uniref:Ig-like domain-containing protein n=1 Tax=Diabrotica balteata TaxID=107213 RepID=A0A9N9TCF1_DIABA|nr:unnamed protein product [Diabrotica balteata]
MPIELPSFALRTGQLIKVVCTITEGDLPVTFEWELNSEPLANFPDITTTAIGKRMSILEIDSIAYHHAGNYTCSAKNHAGTAKYSSELLVNVPPQITPFDFGNTPIHSGQFVQVTCTAFEGDMPIKIDWLLNNVPISDFSDVSVSAVGKRTSFLAIDSVSYTHAGNYTCRAANKAGETTVTSELQVNGY